MEKHTLVIMSAITVMIMAACSPSVTAEISSSSSSQNSEQSWDPQNGSTLIWSDEFDSTINTTRWNYDMGALGFGNNEHQNYTNIPENIFISDGKLVIRATKTTGGAGGYNSARINTRGKF